MGRQKLPHEVVVWEIRLPLELAARCELVLLDPMTNRPKQGARNMLVEQLVREWLNTQVSKPS